MTLDDSIQGFRLRVLRKAQRSGNVSATCHARCSIAGGLGWSATGRTACIRSGVPPPPQWHERRNRIRRLVIQVSSEPC